MIFERILALWNEVEIFSEDYDPALRRLVGGFPQAFSHMGLINSCCRLSESAGCATTRDSRRDGSVASFLA